MKSFEQYLKESISVEGIEATGVQSVIRSGLELVAQFHIYHWLTKSYAQHNALGSFYSSLEDNIDTLAENYIALGGVLSGDCTLFTKMNYNIVDVINNLTSYRALISDALSYTSGSSMLSLNDCLIDIQRLIDKTIYLLELQ